MTLTIEAVYEQGVLRPSQPIPLVEGTRVEVIVISPQVESEDKSPGKILAEIAAMPLQGKNDQFSGQEHDRILYPNHNAT